MKCSRCRLACSALVLFLAGAGNASAQERDISCQDVPAAVRAAFNRAYPKAAIKDCSQEIEDGKTAYEIASKEDHTGRDVLFYADGTVIVVEETIAVGDIPKAVKDALHKRYSDKQVKLAEKVMRQGTVLYEFQIHHQGGIVEVVLDGTGHERKP